MIRSIKNTLIKKKIGFMQGRLSPIIDGKIQAFPWPYWQEEFVAAEENGFNLMEWTLDQDRLHENPLMTKEGREEIRSLSYQHGISVNSLTGDCFMQAPFYKVEGRHRQQLFDDLERILDSCATLGIRYIVMPLVDNGQLENERQEETLVEKLNRMTKILADAKMYILFESDYLPDQLSTFIENYDLRYFGINYDIGNSASLGFNTEEEIAAYGKRILNVHIKDRTLAGGTVPLGEGHADIPATLRALKKAGYKDNYILQTARAADGDHVGVLCKYRDIVSKLLE